MTLLQEVEVMMRSCWECNGAHEHLRNAEDVIIFCFNCGRWFYEGIDVTMEDDD